MKGDKTLAELSAEFAVHPNQITQWKQPLLENASELFNKGKNSASGTDATVRDLHAKIGQLAVENDFLATCSVARSGTAQRSDRAPSGVARDPTMSIIRTESVQCLLSPVDVSTEELRLMKAIDEIHLQQPFRGSRRIRDELIDRETVTRINRKKVQRLMRKMCIIVLYPKKKTSVPGKSHKIYPYLLKGLTIDRPNHVWATDIRYFPIWLKAFSTWLR